MKRDKKSVNAQTEKSRRQKPRYNTKFTLSAAVRFFFGSYRLTFPYSLATNTLDLMLKHAIDYSDMQLSDDGALSLTLSPGECKKFRKIFPDYLSAGVSEKHCGIPAILRRYKRRPGLLCGALIFFTLLRLSTLFVWDVSVSGNDKIGDAEITALLKDYGFGIGSYIPGVDFHELCNACLIGRDDIAWIAVNLSGTTAEVVVIESIVPDRSNENNGSPANMVAARDGYVVRTEVRAGQPEVKVGQTVKKGQLLIGGVWETGRTDERKVYKFIRASGNVFAETVREFQTEVPLSGTVSIKGELDARELNIIFFSKSIKIYKNSSILPSGYGKIERVDRLTLFKGSKLLPEIALPIFLSGVYAEPILDEEFTLTEKEAYDIALRRINDTASAELSNADILERSIDWNITDGTLFMNVIIRCVENIAITRELGVRGS